MAAAERDMNRDPITGEPGAHPVGTGVGATGGAVAGATAGAIGGPVGMAVGGVIGAVVGGLAGKAAGEAVNPTAEENYWRDNHSKESYFEKGRSFEDYAPAYRLGLTGRTRHDGNWDAAEPKLASEWESARSGSGLSWAQAQPASRAAWNRADSQRSGGTTGMSSSSRMGSSGATAASGGLAGMVGQAQSAGNNDGDRGDTLDVLSDLAECSKDGEYGFKTSAERATRQDLKNLFLQRAEGCRGAAQELHQQIRSLGGSPDEGGSAMGAMHRGWVSVKAALSTYDDKAILEECERGEDVALARYRKAAKSNLPAGVRQLVERQLQGVQKNHDQIKMLRDQFRAASS